MVEPTYTRDGLVSVHEIPGKLRSAYDAEAHLVLDTWEDFFVSAEAFREFLLDRCVPFARKNGVDTWIVDSSRARGVLRPEVQTFIEEQGFPRFAAAGVRRMISIVPGGSPLAKMSCRSFQRKAGPHGVEMLEFPSVAAAFEYVRTHPL